MTTAQKKKLLNECINVALSAKKDGNEAVHTMLSQKAEQMLHEILYS